MHQFLLHNKSKQKCTFFHRTLSSFVAVGTFQNRFATIRQTLVFANTHTYANMSWIFCIFFFLKLGTGFPFYISISFSSIIVLFFSLVLGDLQGDEGRRVRVLGKSKRDLPNIFFKKNKKSMLLKRSIPSRLLPNNKACKTV